MKKLVSSLFAVIVMLFGGIFLTACDNATITANFKQTEITLNIGQKLDPFSLIQEELTSEEKEKIDFKTAKSSVAYIDAQKQLVGVNYGTTTLYAVSGETSLASCTVNIPEPPIALSKPSAVTYDENSGKITWNAVYYSLGTQLHIVPDYVVEIKKDDGDFVKHEIENKTELRIEEIGQYTAKVQAKAPSNAFTSSEFSDEYTFKIMSSPTDLAFDMDTQTLSWNHNGNPETTTYKVKYLIAGQVQKEVTATTNSVVIPDALGAGTHTFQIETVPTESDVFKNLSQPLVVEKLSTLSLEFNNGVVSWQGQENATGYNVVVYLDGVKVGEETITDISSDLPKLLATSPSNKYSVTVRALGNEDEFVFGGEVSSEYKFEKLPKAIVSYNTSEKTFEVLNANLGKATLVLSSTQGADRLGGEMESVVWSVTTAVAYELKAQIIALKPAQEIDGDMVATYKLDNTGEEYELIRNLADFSILYQEIDGKAYVKYIDEREQDGIFSIKQNNNLLNISANSGAYEVGQVATMFNQENVLNFEVTRTKAPENKTYFIANSQKLSVEKIASASLLNYEDGSLSVEIPANVEIAKIEYIINDVETSTLDLTQSEWNIKVRFVAKTTAQDGKYYSSSSYAIFQIKRLEKVANLAVDYGAKTIVFDRAVNAVNYEIALGEEKILQEQNTYNFGDYIGQISVTSIAEPFETLTSTEIGYLDSFKQTVEIVKVADIVDLKLQKTGSSQVKAVWVAPAENYGKTINYSVYIKFTSEQNEEDSHDFVLLQSAIAQTEYTFAENQFDKVGQYEIKVQITSPNADFLTTDTAKSVVLTRFSAPMALTKVGNELTVKDYNSETMVGVKIEQEIDGVAGETLYLSEPKYTINIQPGQTLKLKVSYLDTFVEETRKYNLGSLASEFTIYKLGNLTDLKYQGITMGQFQFYATPAELGENGEVPSYVQYSYYASYSTSSTNSRTSTTREILYSNPNAAGFTFFVKASTPSWQTISAGDTKYLSSDEELSVNVYKENAVKDVQIHETTDGVVFSWKFDTITDYTLGQNGYLPAFTLRYVNSINATMTEDVVNEIENKLVTESAFGTGRTDQTGFYEFKFAKSVFADVGSYTIAIKAETSGLTIASEFMVYTIIKLDKITQLTTLDDVSAKLGAQDEEIDLTGVSEVVATGQGITISGTTLDLSGITAGQEVSLEVYKKAVSEISESTYYLDGDKTTFKLVKLEKQGLRLDVDTNNLSWSSVADLPQGITVTYTLKIVGNQVEKEITDIAVTNITLDEVQTQIETQFTPGTYIVALKTVIETMTIVSQDQTEGLKLAYISSDFGAETSVEKLAKVENFKAQYTANEGEVKFTWDTVTNASGYKIYFTDSLGQSTNLSTTETSITYNAFALGATTVTIEAYGKGKLTSEQSEALTVTKLSPITELKVDYQGVISWNTNLESQSVLSAGYVVEIYNSENAKQCEIALDSALLTSTSIFENQAAKTFIESINGQEFIVKVYMKGAVNESGNIISLSSASAELTASKLFEPEIKIENNTVVVTSTNSDVQNLRYFVQIFNGAYEIYNDWYQNPIPVISDGTYFEIKAYATIAQAGVGAYNILDSNTTVFETNKLDVVNGLTLTASNDEYRNQDKVTLSWEAVTNAESVEIADGYEIYVSVNGIETQEPFFVAPKGQTQYEFDAKTIFASSGTYGIKVRAISANHLYSNFTESLSVVRLASMKGAYTTSDAILHFGQVAQASQNYKIFAYIKDGANNIGAVLADDLDKTLAETSEFVNYLNNQLQDGAFYVHVKFVGTTTMAENTITLSSPETVVAGYKLYAPTLTITPDRILVDLVDNILPNGQTVLDVSLTSLAVSNGEGAVQKDDMGMDILGFEGKELLYPNNWLAGEYEFNALAAPKEGVFNVLPSSTTTVTATRLEAPQDLGFKRIALSDTEKESYLSDVEGFTGYLSSKLSFVFETVDNANGYILSNKYEEFGSYLTSGDNEIKMGDALEEFFYKIYSNFAPDEENPEENPGSGDETLGEEGGEIVAPGLSGDDNIDDGMEVEPEPYKEITLIAVAPSGGAYMNSQKATLTYMALSPVEAFYATGEGFSWNTEDSDVATFIIMSIYNGQAKYWQAKDASQRESTLKNLHYAGDMSLNIKAIGNVTTTGTYENIVLDSKFLTHNKQFTKLAKITDLGTDKGFFKFTKIPSAERYVAEVYGMAEGGVIDTNNLILKTQLEDYATKLSLADEDHFVGYSDSISILSPLDTYFIQVRAEAQGQNLLYADYSAPIEAKVLADANASGLTLVNNPENQLDRKIIKVNVTNGALGLWIVEDDKFTAVPLEDGTDRQYTFTPTVKQGGTKVLKFASYGTTSADPLNQHLLTSMFYTKNLNALEKPQISITGGIISWPTVSGADGYYVYINDNLIGSGMYLTTSLVLGNEYGGDANTPVKIEVVPVVVREDGLWGAKGTYSLTQTITDTKETLENSNFTVKLHKPEGIQVFDGSLLWSQGVPGLDNYNEQLLQDLYTEMTTNLTKETIDAFDNAIEALFQSPITIYSKYSGFNQLVVQVTLSDRNGAYTFESDAITFITLTDSQRENLQALVNYIPARLDAYVRSLQEQQAMGELLYDYTREQKFENFTQYAISRLSLILNNFNSSNPQLQQLLNSQNGIRFPGEDILFEELAGNVTAGLGYGSYQITISQRGNNTDWLNSVVSDAQKVYVPMAPQNLKIVEENGNYHLVWDKIVLEEGLSYLANYQNETTTNIVYALFGDNASGNRKLLSKTIGTPYSEQLSLSLTELIESGVMDSSITSIYLVAMGNAEGNTDDTRILTGLRSSPVSVTVLPQVLAKVIDGVLNIDPSTDVNNANPENKIDKFEVSSHSGTDFEKQIISGTNIWQADVLRAGTTYTIDVRFIGGPAAVGQETFVLSGQKRTFRVSKLAPLNVSVNTYGLFEWDRVANASGFILNVSDEDEAYIERDSRVTHFEATTPGFKNYAFRALGTTANVTNSITTYYLNSDVNNEQHGIDAVMLSSINRIFVEEGLIKWTGLDTSILGNQTIVGENELILGYKLSFSNEVAVFTTQLDSSVFTKDAAGNFCFDFTNFGEEGTHTVQIQAYAQVQKSSLEVGTTAYENVIFTQLMGQKFEFAFTKIAPPHNIQIYNGQLVWEGAKEDELYMYKITAPNQLITGQTTEKQVWREEVVPGTQYEFDVRAYQEGMVFSSYSKYVDISTETNDVIKFTKLRFETPVTSKTTEADGNYISFTLPDSAIDLAINLKYKADNESEYSYLNYGDENYYDVMSFTNNLVRINVTKLRDGIQSMEYYMQLVPLGTEAYLSSNFTDLDRYITPQALSVIYYDETAKEFYFEAQEHVGYSIKDQLFNDKGQLVATYYYSIPVQDHTTQSYYKERDVNGTITQTISFTPVVTGYNHVVSVAVCAANAQEGQTALMSPYTTCTQDFRETLFAPEKDIFAADSDIFSLTTQNALSEYLKNNAYGTSHNAYKVDSKEAFANLNLRLTKYSYLSSYTVEIEGLDIAKTLVTEEETTFVFKQTQNIEGVDTSIGLRMVGALSSIKYTGFDNTYDGQNFSISYTLSPQETSDKVALFRVLEANGVIKNLVLNATINYNGASQIAALVGENNGRIEKVTLSSISVSGSTINASSLSSISFGGIVCLNKGEIVNAVNNAKEISFIIRVNGVVVNAGGIVAQNDATGKVIQSGNNMKISISAFQEARVGGIAGYNNGLVEECFNNAQITAVCQNNGSITYVGGLVGYNDTNAQISKAYSKGQIVAESTATSVYAGGVVGYTKSSNIAYTYSSIGQIVITRNTDGSAVKLGGTFVGFADTLTNSVNPNYYVSAPAFGREEDAVIFLSQQIDVTSYTALGELVGYINGELGANVFVYQGSDIHFVWENA